MKGNTDLIFRFRCLLSQENMQRLINKADKVASITVFMARRIREEMLYLLEKRNWSFGNVDAGIENWMRWNAAMGIR